jgi:hypothetical protein
VKAAPPIALSLPPRRGWAVYEALLAGIATGSGLAWGFAHLAWAHGPTTVVALVAAFLVTLGLARRRLPAPVHLAWDGARWALDGDAAEVAVQVDAGPWMLLRARRPATGRVHWLPVTAAAVGPAWHPLRAALYSRPPEATPGGAPPERGPNAPRH